MSQRSVGALLAARLAEVTPRSRHQPLPRAAPPNPRLRPCPAQDAPGPQSLFAREPHHSTDKGDVPVAQEIGIRELLEAGVHFGHQTRRWNPKMRRFIYGERGGIYIIDLLRTEALLGQAQRFADGLARRGGTVLFVGT